MNTKPRMTRIWRMIPTWGKIIGLVAVIALLIWIFKPSDMAKLPTVIVKVGEFVVDLSETGRLRAENSVTLTTPSVRGNRTIIYIIPEGTSVDEGELLVQFDTTEYKEKIDDDYAEVEITRENLTGNLVSMRSRMSDIESSVKSARASYRLSELRLEQLKFESDVQIEEGKLNLLQSKLSLDQAEAEIETQGQIDSADVRSMRLKIRQTELELEKTIRSMAKMALTAPATGLVVYKEMWKGGEMAKVKVGDSPWPGQAILELPDLSVMMVETSVSEVDIGKVKVGQKVEVKLDAYPDPTFHGEVVDVAVLAHDEDGSDAQVFDILIRLEESDPVLRPGMSTTARIIINRFEDVISVPIESVFPSGDKSIVWEADGSDWIKREIKLGARNDNSVIIESGLEADAIIALTDPSISSNERTTELVGSNNSTDDSAGSSKGSNKPKYRVSRRRG